MNPIKCMITGCDARLQHAEPESCGAGILADAAAMGDLFNATFQHFTI